MEVNLIVFTTFSLVTCMRAVGNVSVFAAVLKRARETSGLIDLGQVIGMPVDPLLASHSVLVGRDSLTFLEMNWRESRQRS